MTFRSHNGTIGIRALGYVTVVITAVVLTACTRSEEPAVVTLPERSSTTSIPTMLAPDDGTEPDESSTEPLEIAWVAQVGGPGDDVFDGVTPASPLDSGSGDPAEASQNVVAVGSSTGGITETDDDNPDTPATSTPGTTPAGDRRSVLATRISAEGEALQSDVIDATGDSTATSAATLHTPGSDSGGAAIAVGCGLTSGDLAGPPLGLTDGWCGPLAMTIGSSSPTDDLPGVFGFGFTPFAAESNEIINGIAASDPAEDEALAARQNMYLAGSTDGMFPGAGDSAGRGLGQGDALTFRTSPLDGTSWIRQFGTPFPDASTAVCTTGGSGYFVGWTEGDLAGRSAGGRDAWISMIDSMGMQRWLMQFGYAADEQFNSVACAGDPASGTQQFVAVGVTDGDGPESSNGGTDALVASFAPDGSTLWATQFGGSGDEVATAVIVADDVIYVTGSTTSPGEPADESDGTDPGKDDDDSTTSTTTAPSVPERPSAPGGTPFGVLDDTIGPGGRQDAFLTAIDATTGAILWTSRFGSDDDETVTSATITEDGLLVITGSTKGSLGEYESAGGRDAFAVAFLLPSAGGGGAQSWV